MKLKLTVKEKDSDDIITSEIVDIPQEVVNNEIPILFKHENGLMSLVDTKMLYYNANNNRYEVSLVKTKQEDDNLGVI